MVNNTSLKTQINHIYNERYGFSGNCKNLTIQKSPVMVSISPDFSEMLKFDPTPGYTM
jgi:hypothetical protein